MTWVSGRDGSEHSFLRGFMLTAVAMWGWLLMPYWTDPTVVPPGVRLLLAAVHWVVVAAVVGVVTRRLRLLLAFGFAVVVVLATGGMVIDDSL